MFGLFSLAGLNIVFLQSDRAGLVVNFLIETTGITHYVAARGSSPECCLGCLTISTGCSLSPARRHPGVLGLHQGPVGPVHLVVETAGVTQVVPRVISAPERSVCDTAVNTLSAIFRLRLLRTLVEGVGEGRGHVRDGQVGGEGG